MTLAPAKPHPAVHRLMYPTTAVPDIGTSPTSLTYAGRRIHRLLTPPARPCTRTRTA
jgi:hypothetical protein